jgi:hypothetical protein
MARFAVVRRERMVETDMLAPKTPDLAQAHQREPRQLRDLPERGWHRLEDEDLLFGAKPSHARLVLGKEGLCLLLTPSASSTFELSAG